MRDLTRKFNLRTPVGKKNQIERSNERQTAKETSYIYYSRSKAIFTVAKTCLSWLNEKRVSRRKSRRLNHLIPINEREERLEQRSDLRSRSERTRNKSDEKENEERLNERTSLTGNNR